MRGTQCLFPNLGRMHKYWNLPLHEQLSFNFLVKKKYFHGNMGTNKIWGAPQNYTLRFFSWGRSLKIHIEIKRALFMFFSDMCTYTYLCFYSPCTSCGSVLIPVFFFKCRLFLWYKVIGIISVHTSLRLISALGSEFVNTYPHFF